MTLISHVNQVVQVKKIRNSGYVAVDMINADSTIRKRDKALVVKFPKVAIDAVQVGSLWKVAGQERVSEYVVNNFAISEYTLEPVTVKHLKPSGRILSRWISSNIAGVGGTIANRLARLEGFELAVKNRDRDKLLSVSGMTEARVDQLVQNWPDDHLYEVIEWLEIQELPLGLGHKLIDVFQGDALEKIKLHPFLLMAMGASFEKTMEVSKALGLSLESDAVLSGVAQHYAVAHSYKTGSTVITRQQLIEGCAKIIQKDVPGNIGDLAVKESLLAKVDGCYQVYGAAVQEASVACFLADCLKRPPGKDALLAAWEVRLTKEKVKEALTQYEETLDFTLTDEQRNAIQGAVISPVCGISGGAGTGKTTILKGIISVYQSVSEALPMYQAALSGRAAQRMSESTGLPAQSIAKLIADHVGNRKVRLPSHLLLIIDEASMVDLLSMYKLIGILPPASRILFVGDTEQLPPVGSGLIFHELTDTDIPFYNLSQVKRQADDSDIHRFAMSIRNSSPVRPEALKGDLSDGSDCVLEGDYDVDRLVELWEETGELEDKIVLSPVRKGALGVNNINKKLQAHIGENRKPLSYLDDTRGWIPWVSQNGEVLLEGDPILITKNNYEEDADLRNGDLGVITEAYTEIKRGGYVGALAINGEKILVTPGLLEKISLGYAVTVHKSQGSQWESCIVTLPKEGLKLTDKTLIYTAATRPTKKLIMMGDFQVVEKAVEKGSVALQRRTNLKLRISQALQSYSID